jgi:hypothetical protein
LLSLLQANSASEESRSRPSRVELKFFVSLFVPVKNSMEVYQIESFFLSIQAIAKEANKLNKFIIKTKNY